MHLKFVLSVQGMAVFKLMKGDTHRILLHRRLITYSANGGQVSKGMIMFDLKEMSEKTMIFQWAGTFNS